MADILSPTVIKDIMNQYGLYPKKRLGQNFLIDRNILTKIADSCSLSPEQYVVEIGPGLGALTRELVKRCRGVMAIEIDNSLERILHESVLDKTNLRMVFQDVLKVNIEDELKKVFGLAEIMPYQVCANIPYNITTPIIFKLLESCPRMQSATLMMQKEVADRLMASPGTKEYGRLTITTAYYATVKHVMSVSRHCFYPQPEVDSVVLKITPQHPKKILINNDELFKSFIAAAFQKRRKTLLNIASSFFRMDKPEAEQRLKAIGLEANLRPENLSLDDIARLLAAFAL
ncbi:MAG: 16S rRNA (adenine(1518)-N(6)/adenine(1519)-N(6))-dimethyltransferase RsmA [Syntrophomonadaceae bacterium]|nr:16S rRNA (adenine(1518)-N(6)/adenine(1519)-N(6))-dimethyltransferase RsmA [Syntrophomonadaceae bacterium]